MKKTILLFFILFNICLSEELQKNDFDDFSDFNKEFSLEQEEVFDPLITYNKAMTSFNDFFYLNILEPTAKTYAFIMPEFARIGISNFFQNISFPIRFINNILQLKFENAAEELGRFTVNSTLGFAGLMDPASSELNLKPKAEDFGQTLAFYGVKDGFPIVLPFLGPSNLRDTIGFIADSYLHPITNTNIYDDKFIKMKNSEVITLRIFEIINETSLNPDRYKTLTKDAFDLYPYLRDTYKQKREKEIKE